MPHTHGDGAPICGCPRQGRRRVRRGWVREATLWMLAERPMHGYELITELAARSDDGWRPSPGSIYPTLAALEDDGLIEATDDDGRRTFRVTAVGRALLADPARLSPWGHAPTAPNPSDAALRDAADRLGTSLAKALRNGDPDRLTRATHILDRARRAVDDVLAEETTPTRTQENALS